MNSSKVKTQKSLSAVIAAALAIVTLFQAGTATSHEVAAEFVSAEEAALIAEIDQMFVDEAEEIEIEASIFFEVMETETETVKVFNQEGELIGEGSTDSDSALSQLVNQGDYLSEIGGTKYYRVAQ